ncbi:hypothetical protein JKP88DRAFT_288879 [Tribonema minus]|uniref:SMP-30/Gluconolactonase/LRE-like region domain-containing protein n=1 Tax=Tribonema minus TaxID=303371 RepID=A0A836CHA4_9STRA|nr:hypothetical protein JKP88DRAFT_288879 [Tribonema minus]
MEMENGVVAVAAHMILVVMAACVSDPLGGSMGAARGQLLLAVTLLCLASPCHSVLYQNATALYSGADSNFGTYIEGCTVDRSGAVYALNYLRNFDGTAIKDTDARTTLGVITGRHSAKQSLYFKTAAARDAAAHPNTDVNSITAIRVKATTPGQWNGARFAPPSVLPPRPGGGSGYSTALIADQTAHKVIQAWFKAGEAPVLRTFCASVDMVEPNDVVVASNGRVFASGQRYAYNNVVGRVVASNGRVFASGQRCAYNNVVEAVLKFEGASSRATGACLRQSSGDGDLWTCSPTRTVGASKATRLLQLGRTNGIELSPNETTLYLSEALNKDGQKYSAQLWRFKVDIKTGAVSDKRLFVDFAALDGTQGSVVDGIRVDVKGNLYVTRNGGWEVAVFAPNVRADDHVSCRNKLETAITAPLSRWRVLDDVDVFAPDARLLRRIRLNFKSPTNLEFGGPDGKTLYVVGRCGDAAWTQGVGCVDTYQAPAAGRSWTLLQNVP